MSTDRDTPRIVRSWLEQGVSALPDRVLDAVLDQLPATPQRRPSWPARRTLDMHASLKLGLAAAAALVVAVAGFSLLGPENNMGNSSPAPPTSVPTPSFSAAFPSESPGPWVLTSGALAPHEYFTRPLPPPNEGMTFTFSVPDGWTGFAPYGIFPNEGSWGPTGMGFGIGWIDRLYSDPCKSTLSTGLPAPGDVIVGPTVDDLSRALLEQRAYTASAATETELGGYSGRRIDLQLPFELPCAEEDFRPWEGSIYAQGPGDRWHLWILDVQGVRVVVLARDFAATPPADQAELQGIVDSLRITP